MHLRHAAAGLAVLLLAGGCSGATPVAADYDRTPTPMDAGAEITDHDGVTDHGEHDTPEEHAALHDTDDAAHDAEPQGQTFHAVLGGGDVELPYHVVDGERFLGPAPAGRHAGHGGHDHPTPDPADFPRGVVPARLVVPTRDVDLATTALPLGATVSDPDQLAWFPATRRPGEIGPAVFSTVADVGLDGLAPGDELRIVADDGTQLTFAVDRIDPVDDPLEIYAMGRGEPELRVLLGGPMGDRIVRATLA